MLLSSARTEAGGVLGLFGAFWSWRRVLRAFWMVFRAFWVRFMAFCMVFQVFQAPRTLPVALARAARPLPPSCLEKNGILYPPLDYPNHRD